MGAVRATAIWARLTCMSATSQSEPDRAKYISPSLVPSAPQSLIGAVISPVMGVTLTNHQVLLSWPASANTYHLETTTNLVLPSSWSDVTNTPAQVNGQNTVTLPVSDLQRFFRLHSE